MYGLLEKVEINNSQQWVLVQGKSLDLPLFIQVQFGPGFPLISEAKLFNKLINLEEHFLVVYWDLRGCGKSYYSNIDSNNLNYELIAEDIVALSEYLLKKYNKPNLYAAGYSIGATYLLQAAVNKPELFKKLILLGTNVVLTNIHDFSLKNVSNKIKGSGDKTLIEELDFLRNASMDTVDDFNRRTKLLADFGQIMVGKTYNQIFLPMITRILLSSNYSLKDFFNSLKAMKHCANILLPIINKLDLFYEFSELKMPVTFVHGALDGLASIIDARSFYEGLKAPSKEFIEIKDVAHLPHLEAPDKFREIVLNLID